MHNPMIPFHLVPLESVEPTNLLIGTLTGPFYQFL
jgi:hypothetical protein